MLTLESVKAKTQSIFESADSVNELKLPEPSVLWKDKIQALEEANLTSQRASLIFDMRCWQAEQLGFQRMTTAESVELLMGSPHTETEEGTERQAHEWAYNHHTDELLGKGWGDNCRTYTRCTREGLWHMPPFAKKLVWTCREGKLDYLKREIPYGVVLRINECKQLKLFNSFCAVAPAEAWEKKTEIDPIVLADIWELPPNSGGKYTTSGPKARFFLAQW